jgi:hypothetical protein
MPESEHTLQNPDNLLSFFREELQAAFDDLGISPADETEAYLVHLLKGFARMKDRQLEELGFRKPAAIMMGEAMNATGEKRLEAYRKVGDLSLFNCGFFAEHLTRRCMSEDYYRDMGKMAYKRLDDVMSFKQPDGIFAKVYKELVVHFGVFVEAFKHLGSVENEAGKTLDDLRNADVDQLEGVDKADILFSNQQGES